MKKRTLVLGLAALCLSFGSMAILGGVSSNIGSNAIVTKAAVGDAITIGEGTYKEIYRTGFESADSGTNYKNTVDLTSDKGDGLAWKIEHGCVSKTTPITGNQSAQMRLYSDSVCGYLTNTSVLTDSVDAIQLTYKVNKKAIQFNIDYTIDDGATWTTLKSVSPESASEQKTFTHEFDSSLSNFRLRVIVTGGFPDSSTSNPDYRLIIDDIIFAKKDAAASISVENGDDVLVGVNQSKTLNLKKYNIPDDATYSVAFGTENIATATISEDKASLIITGTAVGSTTYTVSTKDSSGADVTYSGSITVAASIEGISISSTFADGATLKVGQTYNINVAATPDGASTSVTWEISDAKAASISDKGVLTVLEKTGDELITLTAKSAVDSTKTAMLTFYVDNEFDIADLISQDGVTAPNGLISGSSEVVTHGTVTAIDKTLSTPSIYLQSGESALIISTTKSDFTSLSIGSGLKVSGKFKLESGVTKLTSPEIVDQGTSYNDATAMELSSDNMVAKNTNRIATATGCTATSSSSIEANLALESPANLSIGFALKDSSETSYVLYIKKAAQQSAFNQFGDIEEGIAYDVKGIYSLYNGTTQEIVFAEGASYYNTKLTDFIATYITPYSGDPQTGDSCKTKYENAKAVLDGLTEATQNTFKTATAYNSAYEIYHYWELNQTSVSTAKLVASSNTSDWGNAALIAGAFILVGGATFFFIHNNKKKQDR